MSTDRRVPHERFGRLCKQDDTRVSALAEAGARVIVKRFSRPRRSRRADRAAARRTSRRWFGNGSGGVR